MRSKVILFCALFLCSKVVESIPFGNEELSRQRAYPPINWQGNQNTAEQYHDSGFARTQNGNSMTNTAQQFENGQEYNSHQGRHHYENKEYNNQATLLQSLPSKDSQVNFAQVNERRFDNFPTRRDQYPRTENHQNHPVRVNNPFMLNNNWGNRFSNSAQTATASATSVNEKPLVTVNEPYQGPSQHHVQFRPPVHEQSQQQLIHQRQLGGSYPVSKDFHYYPIADKSDTVGHVEHNGSNSGSRVGAVRYENYHEAHAHSSAIANSESNAYIQNPRPYAKPPRFQHYETYNEPAVVKPKVFMHSHGGYFGHHGTMNNANKFNDGRVIPTNTGFNNRHIENPILLPRPNNHAYNGYQAPIAPANKGRHNIGNIKYLENPINFGSNHPPPLHAYRNDQIPDNNRHVHSPVIYTENDNQASHTYIAPEAPVEIPTILDEAKNNGHMHNGPDNQGPTTYVSEAPLDKPLKLDGPETDKYEETPVLYPGQEDNSTYTAPIDTPETYDESDNAKNVEESESKYSAPVHTNESQEPIKTEGDNSPLIHDQNKDSSIPIDKFVDNINSSDREKLKAHSSESKKNFVLIDTASGSVEYINNLQTAEPPNYVVVKKNDKPGDNISPPFPSQPANPISEEPKPPLRNNENDYNPSPQLPIGDDYNPLPVKQPSNNNQNDYNPSHTPLSTPNSGYNPSPQFPIDDDYKTLPVNKPPNNNQYDHNPPHMPLSPPSNGYTTSPQFPINDDYKPVPVKPPPNNSNYNESIIQQPQSDNNNNSPSEPTNHNNNYYYKPLSRPQMSNNNNNNPIYESQYPNVYNHHNYHREPQRPPHVDGRQYHPFNPTWANNAPGSPSKLHTHVLIPTSTTPAPIVDEKEPKKLHTHLRLPTSTTPAPTIDEEEHKKLHTHVRPSTSSTPAPEVDEKQLKKYLDTLPKQYHTHHKPSSTESELANSNDDNDNLNTNNTSHDHKSSKATSITTTTTESDEFIEEFLESLSKKPNDLDVPCNDGNGATTPKPSKLDENNPLNNVTTSPSKDYNQTITLSPIELATDNVKDDLTHHLHDDKLTRNTNKSETTTKLHHQKSSNQNESDDKDITKNKKDDYSDDDTNDDVKKDTKKSETKTACNDYFTNSDVPAIPDDNSAAETNSENRDDVYTSDSTITGDYLIESSTGALKITVRIPNDSDGTIFINVQVPDSTGDEDTSGEGLVVSFAAKNSSEASKQSTNTTDNSQGGDQNKEMVIDLSNAVVLMNRTSDRDYLSQLMPSNSSLTVFIIEMPPQDKALVESYKETKIYPNGTCVEETKKTTWKNEHDQVPTVVTTRKIYSCE